LPDVYESHNSNIGLFIMVGILFQIILEFFSKGAEHGHVHGHETMSHIPWLLFVSLCIHAFLEGFPVSHHHNLALGIAIHHLPIAIILTMFFINAQLDKKAIFAFMITFAVMTPLGTILSDYLPVLNNYYNEITAVVIGILFHISSTIIFESSEGHKFNIAKVSMIIFGVVLAYFI
jgi:zinc transporter ZupT